jgi:hypothetical protein
MGSTRFSTHSQPVGLAFGTGSTRLVCLFQTGLRGGGDLVFSGVPSGASIGMVFQLVELVVDFRQAAGVGGNELVDFSFPQTAAIAAHGGGFRAKVLCRRTVNQLGFERGAIDAFGHPGFSEGAVAARLPHLADSLDFGGAEFAVVEIANLRLGKIAFVVHGASRHENMSVNIAMVALRIGMVQAHAKPRAVGVAQLKAEPAQKIPLHFRVQLMRKGDIHRPAHAGVPALLRPFGAGGKFAGRHGGADDLRFDDIRFVPGPIVLFAGALIGQFAACVVGNLRNGAVAFCPADRADGQVENRHVSNRGFGLVGKKDRCPARGSEPPPPAAGRTGVAGDFPRCVSALRLSSKGSGSSEVLGAWVAAYFCEGVNGGASFATKGNTERKSSASCGDACAMSWLNNG